MKKTLLSLIAVALLAIGAHAQFIPLDTIQPLWFKMGGLPSHVNQYAKNGNRLYAATTDGLFWSDDDGEHWVQMTNLPVNNTRGVLAIGGLVLAFQSHYFRDANDDGRIAFEIVRSVDGGLTFDAPQPLLEYPDCFNCNWFSFNGFYHKNDGTIYMLYQEHPTSAQYTPFAKYSTDNGQTWTDLTSAKVSFLFFDGNTAYASHRDTLYVAQQSDFSDVAKTPLPVPLNSNNMFLANGTIYRQLGVSGLQTSTDGGQTWNSLAIPSYGSFRVIDDEVYFTIEYTKGLLRATDASLMTWDTLFMPNPNYLREIHRFDVFGDEIFLCGHGNLTYRSLDGGNTWEEKTLGMDGEGFLYKSLVKAGNGLLAMSNGDNAVFRSEDNGLTWTFFDNPSLFQAVSQSSPQDGILWFLRHNDKLFAVVDVIQSQLQVIRSDDEGATWTQLPNGRFNNFGPPRSYGDRVVSNQGFDYFIVSDNNGDTWYQVPHPAEIVIDFEMLGDSLVASVYDPTTGVYDLTFSHDLGTSWHRLGFSSDQYWELDLYGSKVVAGNDTGVKVSYDTGASWQQTGQAFPHVAAPNETEIISSYGMTADLLFFSHLIDHYPGQPVAPEDFERIIISKDDGANWDALQLPVQPNHFFENDGSLFVSNLQTLWRTGLADIHEAINLANLDSITVDTTICAGQLVGNVQVFSDTNFVVPIIGSDTSLVYEITVLPNDTTQTTIGLCQHEFSPLTGIVYDDAGNFAEQMTLTNQFGCDSLVLAEVVVHPEEFNDAWGWVPYGFTENGVVFTQDTIMYYTDTTEYGCLVHISFSVYVGPNSVDESQASLKLQIHPNPVASELHLQIELASSTVLSIEAIDPMGRKMADIVNVKPFAQGAHRISVATADWPSGVYFLRIQLDGQVLTRRVVKR